MGSLYNWPRILNQYRSITNRHDADITEENNMGITKWKGFGLVRIIKATTDKANGGDAPATHMYECEVHGIGGIYQFSTLLTVNEFQRTYGTHIGMTKCRFGILRNGFTTALTYNDYHDKVVEWEQL